MQFVSDNARCAVLAITQIHELVEQGYFPASFAERVTEGTAEENAAAEQHHEQQQHQRLPFIERLSSFLDFWSMHICNDFIHLNALNRADRPFYEIGRALKIVLSRRTCLTAEEHQNLGVRYGLLFDTHADSQSRDPSRPRYRIPQSVASVFFSRSNLGGGYQGNSESNSNTNSHNHNNSESTNDSAAGDAVASPASEKNNRTNNSDDDILTSSGNNNGGMMMTNDNDTSTGSDGAVATTVPTSSAKNTTDPAPPLSFAMFKDVRLTNSVLRINLRKQLVDGKMSKEDLEKLMKGEKTPEKSQHFISLEQEYEQRWKNIVQAGGAVVIVNGPMAPFADVIVLILGFVFLTRMQAL